MHREELLSVLSQDIRKIIKKANIDYSKLQEIRLRNQKPLLILVDGKEVWLDANGMCTNRKEHIYTVTTQDMKEILAYVSDYSIYAYEEELKQGFLTILGGHRVGVAGRVVTENEKIKGMKYINNINIRVAHEIKGCADKLLPWLYEKKQFCHTLIISGPGCGKTTILRDLVRQISNGTNNQKGYTVGVVDERSEIAACYHGIPQNDVGMRTDILDCCPKEEGMLMFIRSMAPEVIAVDELGKRNDITALETAICCGCKILATVHGTSLKDLKQKPIMEYLLKEQLFERYVILCGKERIGQVQSIYNRNGVCIYGVDK